MLSVATPPRARADSFVEFEGFRYRLNVVPEYTGVEGHMPVSATLVEALSYEDAIMGVKLPDFVYADGVQYPVTGIESTAYTGYYGIKSVGYNKFCGRVLIGKALRVLISLRYMSSTIFMAHRASSTDGLPSER